MKIAVFHHLPEGGAKIALFEQLKRLRNNHELFLFTFTEEEGEYDLKQICRQTYLYPYQAVPLVKKHGMLRIIDDFKTFSLLRMIHKKIAEDIDQKNFDLVFSYHSRLTQAPYLLRYLKTPSLYFCFEPLRMVYEQELRLEKDVGKAKHFYENTNRYIRKRIDFTNARSATRILTGSKYAQQYLKRVYGKSVKLCKIGVDANFYKPTASKSERQGFLFIGSRTQIKGYELISHALHLIKEDQRPSVEVIEPSNKGFKKTSRQLINIYSQKIATLCTSVNEPFGLVALESMACKTPVIAVKEGGYKETVVDQKTGYLINRDPIQLAEKMLYLSNNKKLVRKMGKRAREHVKTNWNWEKSIKILEKDLEKTARGKR